MKHIICLIDDKIPVSYFSQYFNDTDIINESVLNFLIQNESAVWEDSIVKMLCATLMEQREQWVVNAFTSPHFYWNYIENAVYSPEIIIYDWDYNAGALADDSERYLLEILSNSHAMVFVFSAQDNIAEITEIVSKTEFLKFSDRLSVIDKNEGGSIEKVFSQIKTKEENNFSFRYGREIIYKSNRAINKILSDISQLSIEDFIASVDSKLVGDKYIANNDAFIDVILPRYNNILRNYRPIQEISVKKTKEAELASIRDIWSYRIYDRTPGEYVQMGDVIKNEGSDEYYLVISSDCHMRDHWKKNFGYVTLVPLYEIGKERTKQLLNISGKFVDYSFHSMTSNNKSPMTILPCMPVQQDLLDFVVIPKGVCSVPVAKKDSSSLLYEDFIGYTRVVSLSDPFKSPLIQFVCNNISGYGCPNFHNLLKENLDNHIKEMKL